MNLRIGSRQRVDVRDVVWTPDSDRRRRMRLRRDAPQTARLVDLSYSGASVVAPRGLEVGATVAIEVAGMRGHVIVRRFELIAGSPLARYGVQFESLDAALRDLITRTLDSHVPDAEWRWNRAN